jgi:membrane-bound serine protease (ClpP class)
VPSSQDPKAFRPASTSLSESAARDVDEALDVPTQRPEFGPADAQRYELVEYAADGQTLLTLKERELKRFGLADPNVSISSDADLQAYVGATHIRRLDQSWSESLVAFMTQGISGWITRALLIVVFLMAMFIEMSIPGATVPGLIALLALGGLVVPPMLVGAATWWALAAIVGGVLSLLLEIFVLPGFGVAGVLGLLLLFAGLVGTFADAGELFPGAGKGGGADLAWAASVVLLSIFVAGTGVYLFVKHTHRFPIAGRLVLSDRQRGTDVDEPTLLGAMTDPTPAAVGGLAVGAVGRTITPLRPSGSAEFGERIVDVVSEFGFVDAGKPVRITSVTEYRVGVEPHGASRGPQTGRGSA